MFDDGDSGMSCFAIAAVFFIVGIIAGLIMAFLIFQSMPPYPFIHGPLM